MEKFLCFTEQLLSSYLPFTLLLIIGLYISFKGKFFQFTRFFESISLVKKAVLKREKSEMGITSLQSALTALSATVGTGNIAGVAGAISLGGAGAVFWMWVSAVLGMAIKFAEIALSIIFREKNKKSYIGGPMYIIKNALPQKFKSLGLLFAFCCIFATFCTGNITQVNAAVLSFTNNIYIKIFLGILFAILTLLVISGGGKRIGKFTEKTVPVMSILYLILSLGIIILNIDFLPTAFKMIINGAFNPKAVTGGIVGSVLNSFLIGASRGVFSNEAGLGTSAMAHSLAFDAKAQTQGLFGIFEVFIDTILICTLTALTILCSRVNINYGSIASSELVTKALSCCYGDFSSLILGVMMNIFAFSSVIGWALYGEISAEFLLREKGIKIFRIIYPLFCIFGAVCNANLAWRLSEFFNGIMLCINLPLVLMLSDELFKHTGGIKNDGKKNFKFR